VGRSSSTISFKVPTQLVPIVDDICSKYGFKSRSEFIRYLILNFIREQSQNSINTQSNGVVRIVKVSVK